MRDNANHRLKILFLSRWYPNRTDAMSGLFVRNHAEAVGRLADVCVLYPCADADCRSIELHDERIKGIREVHIYFPFTSRFRMQKVSKLVNFCISFVKGWHYIRKNFGTPDIVHANVHTLPVVWAWLIKSLYGIPYVVTEHFSRYLPEHECFHNPLHRLITRDVASCASSLMPVSDILGEAMRRRGLHNKRYVTINNVVEDFFFYSPDEQRDRPAKVRFIHVSCFSEKAKNVTGILRATRRLAERRQDFELVLVGSGIDFEAMRQLAAELNFPDGMIHFTGEITPRQVKEQLSAADAFVMFSNYETACVSFMEAVAAGVPCIATPTGVVPEYIDEAGICVPFGDEAALCEAMNRMIDECRTYDPAIISRSARSKYGYDVVGKKILAEYEIALNNNYQPRQTSATSIAHT